MEARTLVWLGGRILPIEEAVLPLEDDALLEGGFFETIRFCEGFPWFHRRHRERIQRSCRTHGIAVDAASLDPRHLRALVDALDPPAGWARCRTIALASGRVLHTAAIQPPPRYDVPFRLAVHPARRHAPEARHKALPYAFYRRAQRRARSAGGDAALLLSPDGLVLETSFQNVLVLRGSEVVRPPEDSPRLVGVTERVLVEAVLPAMGLPVEERPISLEDIAESEGVLLSSSVRGVVAASEIDGQPLRDAAGLAARIRDELRAAAIREAEE